MEFGSPVFPWCYGSICHNSLFNIKKEERLINERGKIVDIGWADDNDQWSITEDDNVIEGYTHMDNFDMYTFLVNYLDIPQDYIKWGD